MSARLLSMCGGRTFGGRWERKKEGGGGGGVGESRQTGCPHEADGYGGAGRRVVKGLLSMYGRGTYEGERGRRREGEQAAGEGSQRGTRTRRAKAGGGRGVPFRLHIMYGGKVLRGGWERRKEVGGIGGAGEGQTKECPYGKG